MVPSHLRGARNSVRQQLSVPSIPTIPHGNSTKQRTKGLDRVSFHDNDTASVKVSPAPREAQSSLQAAQAGSQARSSDAGSRRRLPSGSVAAEANVSGGTAAGSAAAIPSGSSAASPCSNASIDACSSEAALPHPASKCLFILRDIEIPPTMHRHCAAHPVQGHAMHSLRP
jgi:hypothetical protein